MIEKHLERFENVLVNSGYVWEVRLLTYFIFIIYVYLCYQNNVKAKITSRTFLKLFFLKL